MKALWLQRLVYFFASLFFKPLCYFERIYPQLLVNSWVSSLGKYRKHFIDSSHLPQSCIAAGFVLENWIGFMPKLLFKTWIFSPLTWHNQLYNYSISSIQRKLVRFLFLLFYGLAHQDLHLCNSQVLRTCFSTSSWGSLAVQKFPEQVDSCRAGVKSLWKNFKEDFMLHFSVWNIYLLSQEKSNAENNWFGAIVQKIQHFFNSKVKPSHE